MGASSRFRVVICGAGIGGLTLAVALSKYPDIDVEIYEAATKLAEVGAGIGIFPRPWEVIQKLGIEDDLLKRCEMRPKDGPVKSFRYRKSDQSKGIDFFELVTKGTMFAFHRADFQQVLLDHLPPSYRTHCSKKLKSYTQHSSGSIDVFFEDGTSTKCDLLIGADGLKSAVRKVMLEEKIYAAKERGCHAEIAELKGSIEPLWTGQNAYRFLIPAERLRARAPNHSIFRHGSHQYLGKNGYVIAYPISMSKIVNFVAFTMDHDREYTTFSEPWFSVTEKSEFESFFAEWEQEVQDLVACVDKPLRWAVHTIRPLKSYIHGRVGLLGDAAHAMVPHQGAGAGQAIEDAYILGAVLGHKRTTRATLSRALEIYEETRLPFSQDVARRSRWNGHQFSFAGWEFDRLPEDQLMAQLQKLGQGISDNWSWCWSTSINEAFEDALRRVEAAS